MLEFRAERSELGEAPDIAVVDVGLNFFESQKLTGESRAKKQMAPAPSPHKKPVSIRHE